LQRIIELGMFDDTAQVLEEIEPEDKSRNEVLGAPVNLYMAARNGTWQRPLPATLVKLERDLWINLAYSVRGFEVV
jgi:hypothetical protein